MRSLFRSVVAISALVLAGCGSAAAPTRAAPVVELEPMAVFMEISRASSARELFEAPDDDPEIIEEQLEDAGGDERDRLVWTLVRARIALLEESHANRPELQTRIREAIEERDAAVVAIRERREQSERQARDALAAAERDRQRAAAEADRAVSNQADEYERERQRLLEEARQRLLSAAEEEEQQRARREQGNQQRSQPYSGASDDERERARQRADEEFRRRAAEANERRRRREGGYKGVGSEAKQSRRRMRERQRRRRRRAAARRARRQGSASGRPARRVSRREARSSRRERRRRESDDDDSDEGVAEYGLTDDADIAELQPFVQRERDARRALTQAEDFIEAQREGLEDLAERFAHEDVPAELKARIDFAYVWAAWRTEHENAGQLAEEFTEAHPGSGDLLALAWMIRGEIASDEMEPQESLAAFRFGMNRLGEPLYAYSLWRSASVQQASGDDAAARESLLGVEQEACSEDAPELSRRLAYAAASALGHDVRVDPDGVTRPETCPVPGERRESEGWRPEE